MLIDVFNPPPDSIIRFPKEIEPILAIAVDAEEEFDWTAPRSRQNSTVRNIAQQHKAHEIFDKYSIKPIYLVDFPVANSAEGSEPLRNLLLDGACDVGSHLHPWVNPPYVEEVNNRNSYPGNLSPEVEQEKLRVLTEVVSDAFGISPIVYRAGRFGIGSSSTTILKRLGYEVDTSVVATTNFRRYGGPDFRNCPAYPYWLDDDRSLLEVPLSAGFSGLLSGSGTAIQDILIGRIGRILHAPGLFARARLLDQIRLTPEAMTSSELQRLTAALYSAGHRVFVMSYHSSSLLPGAAPYVTSSAGLTVFLDRIESYMEFFFGVLLGRSATITEIYRCLHKTTNGVVKSDGTST